MDDYIAHIGNENSGRYPRGSGKNPYQRDPNKRKQKRKEKLLATRSAQEAYANRTKYTDEELRIVLNRINMDQQLSKIASQESVGVNKIIKKALSYGKTINEIMKFLDSPAGKILKRALL